MALSRGLMVGFAGAGQGLVGIADALKEYKLKQMDIENDRLAEAAAENTKLARMEEKFNLGKEDRLVAR